MVQLSCPYLTTGKTIGLTRQTFVGKVMSLLFNMLPRLVIAFLPRSKCLLISWLWLPSAVILEPKKIKSVTVSIVSPSIFHEVVGLDAMILVFWMLNFKPTFSLSSLTFTNKLFNSSSLFAILGCPVAQTVKRLSMMRETRFNPWVGEFPWEGSGNLLQYSCLENTMDRGFW